MKNEKVKITKNAYRMLHPRPVVLIVSRYWKENVMAAAWTTPVSEEPPLVAICIWKGGFTHNQITKSGEFTINIPTDKMLKAVLKCGKSSGRKIDKAKLAGLTYKPAKKVGCQIINECVGHMECKVKQRIDGGECWIFLAEVLASYGKRSLVEGKEKVLLHMGGDMFAIPKVI